MRRPALVAARAAGWLSRRLGQGGGTSMPGKVLLRVRPEAVAELGRGLPRGAAVVSATNGKTTTARMIAACIQAAGWPAVANPAGANLLSGVATALAEGAGRRPRPEVALFEVDEAALPEVVRQLRPRVVVLMNLFRDQLDRYGELEHLAERWAAMVAELGPGASVVLNADDPAIAALAALAPSGAGGGPRVVTFGVEAEGVGLPGLPHAADSTRCRRCGAALHYDLVTMGHLGHWRCPACHLARPRPEVAATHVALDGVRGLALTVRTPEGDVSAEVPLPGLHNAYNATAAVAAARALGVPHGLIGPALAGSAAAFGRAERMTLSGRELVLLLAKNPAGANETVRTVLLDPEPLHLLIALNDRTADGHDVSWIWDVDYEPLLHRLAGLTLAGERAYDLALRFRYAVPHPPTHPTRDRLDPARMRVVRALDAALDAALAAAPAGGVVYALPTYTAMLDLRRDLVRRGAAQAFWRER